MTTSLRLWIGTWNVGTGDSSVDISSESSLAELDGFIDRDCDVYLLSLQESFTEGLIDLISLYLQRYNRSSFSSSSSASATTVATEEKGGAGMKRVQPRHSQVGGLGDGAFLRVKYTRIAVWIRDDLLYPRGSIKLIGGAVHPLGVQHGSKGAVSMVLELDPTTSLAFIGCHLPANNVIARHQSLQSVLKHVDENVKSQNPIIIVCGDLNFRLRAITPLRAAEVIESTGGLSLLEYDEGVAQLIPGGILQGYKEPKFTTTSLPSYKKREDRPSIDRSQRRWPHFEYQMVHTNPWYKCGRDKTRCPSFCDRVFFRGAPSIIAENDDAYYTVQSETTTSPHVLLNMSDHSPVRTTFLIRLGQKTVDHDDADKSKEEGEIPIDAKDAELPKPSTDDAPPPVVEGDDASMCQVSNDARKKLL